MTGVGGHAVLEVEDLVVDHGPVRALDGVSLSVDRGEVVAVVGASGSGKSTLARAVLGLFGPRSTTHVRGAVRLGDVDLTTLAESDRRALRGRRVALVPQDPLGALDPTMKVGRQLAGCLRHGEGRLARREAADRAVELLRDVGIVDPAGTSRRYPHELSGGMRQRVLIATAVSRGPDLVIADEATTGLDATIQAQVLELLDGLRRARGLSLLLVSHDLGVVAQMADRVVVLDGGRVAEQGRTAEVFASPATPAASRLVAAARARPAEAVAGRPTAPRTPVIRARGVVKEFHTRGQRVRAVDRVDVAVEPDRTHALVGESGSGKSTLARMLVGLEKPDGGTVELPDTGRPRPQMVFQDPASSFDPRMTVGAALGESYSTSRRARGAAAPRRDERSERVRAALATVGLDPAMAARHPHELSGGEAQRAAVARALMTEPEVVVLDEPMSSLDAPHREGITALLADLQAATGLAYLLVSHDLTAVERLADAVSVMYLGRIVEQGPARTVLGAPRHPYTAALVSAVPVADPRAPAKGPRIVLEGEPPRPGELPEGCRFRTRCWRVVPECHTDEPALQGSPAAVACHNPCV